ncbi:MAG: hypothetical protein R2911_32805 [Caldilineaceae bacterium]
MRNAKQYPYIAADSELGEASLRPFLPLTLIHQGNSIEVVSLLDTGAMINVLPPLTGMENVILTPHVAAGSVQAGEEIYLTGIQNALDILAGYWPLAENVVNSRVAPRFLLMERS